MAYKAPSLTGGSFATNLRRVSAIPAVLVPPNTNRRSRFEMEFLQNVLHVFLHRARAASENLSDLAVAFAGADPFRDFEFALCQRARPFGISGSTLVYLF
jgi:hypothetical protein